MPIVTRDISAPPLYATRESDPFGSTPPPAHPATEKQIAFLVKLAGERGLDIATVVGSDWSMVSKTAASKAIDALLKAPKPTAAPTAPGAPARPARARREPAEPGMYRTADGTFYKVQIAVHGSGRPYAKVLIVDEPAVLRADGTIERPGECHFEIAYGWVYKLTPADKLTDEQAKAFGALYGTCCSCARTLTDENSIFNGYGEKCAGNNGWPYVRAPKIRIK